MAHYIFRILRVVGVGQTCIHTTGVKSSVMLLLRNKFIFIAPISIYQLLYILASPNPSIFIL